MAEKESEAGYWVVTRDGEPISEHLATEDECWSWILRHQSMSVDWAMKYEGYGIRKVD